MKKKVYLWSVLAMGLTLAACSDDLENGPDGGGLSGEKGYVKVAINLPTEGFGTRAAAQDGTDENDKFENATQAEYSVNNAIIAFFKADRSASESSATFVTAKTITTIGNSSNGDANGNVQAKYSYTIDGIPTVEVDEQMYALVILNNNGLFAVNNDKLYFDETGNGSTTTEVSSFSSLCQLSLINQTSATAFTESGFFMTNAPIADRPSVTASFSPQVTTLAKVTVYENDPSNDTNVAADPVYVERAVAKVEVDVTGKNSNATKDGTSVILPVTIGSEDSKTHKVKFTRWALNVTNKSSKIVRDVTGYATWASYFNTNVIDKENRFFGTTPKPYRVYWAVDPNYTENENSKSAFNHFSETSEPSWKTMLATDGNTSVDYCFENTMDAKRQIQGFTTGVLLEGTYQIAGEDNADLFTLGASDAVYSEDEMLGVVNNILGLTGAEAYVFVGSDKGGVIGTGGDEAAKIADFQKYFKKSDDSEMTDAHAKALLANSNIGTINYYKGGRTYYWSKPIKHFGDQYTPIYKDGKLADYYEDASSYDDANHLGRYGVVRNNWYELNITSVSGPGYPTIPDIPTDSDSPDDSGEGYVKVEVNILSWAKRSQNVDL